MFEILLTFLKEYKMKIFRIILFLLFIFSIFALPGDAHAISQDVLSKFYEANLAYKEGEYKRAAELYEGVVRSGFSSGALYYNLGNSYFKIGNLGMAIVNYERAKLFIPRDGDLGSNENYVYSLTQARDLSAKRIFLFHVLDRIKNSFTYNEFTWFLLIFYVVFGLFIALGVMLRLPKKNIFVIVGLFFVVIIFVAFMLISKLAAGDQAAIITVDTDARFEPQEDATAHFLLHPGSKINVLVMQDGWAKIKREDGKIGWISAKDFEKIHI